MNRSPRAKVSSEGEAWNGSTATFSGDGGHKGWKRVACRGVSVSLRPSASHGPRTRRWRAGGGCRRGLAFDVLLVEAGEARDPPRRPEPRLDVPDGALDRSLLARRRRRAGGRVEGVVAPERDEPPVPLDKRRRRGARRLSAGCRRRTRAAPRPATPASRRDPPRRTPPTGRN